ncbi:MAG: hypothetical protein HOP30_15015 [Cyclobacteriaceae bacterium]|nr:hypothetical protein [Cyclobacteriaceae bacterium]
METKGGITTFHAKTRSAWRKWLDKNSSSEKSVWLIIYHKQSKKQSVYYPEAVDEALCFGWVDSKPNKRDHESYYQFFTKRNPKSKWSKINKEKVERLMAEGLMTPSGMEMVSIAKGFGTWDALTPVDNLEEPDDLKKAFSKKKTAYKNWQAFPPSTKRGILEWLLNAKRPETRSKRITETVSLAAQNIRANQYRPS